MSDFLIIGLAIVIALFVLMFTSMVLEYIKKCKAMRHEAMLIMDQQLKFYDLKCSKNDGDLDVN